MNFIQIYFIIFLIVVLFFYYHIPKSKQWICLLIASIAFYLSYTKWYILILFGSITITYITAILMQKKTNQRVLYLQQHKKEMSREESKLYKQSVKKQRKVICFIGITLNIGFLVYFKYTNFILDTLNRIFHSQFTILSIIAPIGISYFIFKSTGYMFDIYRENYEAENNYGKLALFVSFFPAILMGPIGRFGTEKEQLFSEHSFYYDSFMLGIQRIIWGFFKKMVIADRLGNYVSAVFGKYETTSGFQIALTILLFAIQEYADFSGFMDIAMGVARLFGIYLTENFRSPFMSNTVGEFWRRWHITMGAWFRDYVFYEIICSKFFKNLAKNKKMSTFLKQAIPVIIANVCIWSMIGFWHGASWHHVFWGWYNGVLIIGAFLLQGMFTRVNTVLHIKTDSCCFHVFQKCRTFLLFALGELFFTASTFGESIAIGRRVVSNPDILQGIHAIYSYAHRFRLDALTAVVSIVVLLVVDVLDDKQIHVGEWIWKQKIGIRWSIYLIGIFSIVLLGVYGLDNAEAFIYMGM